MSSHACKQNAHCFPTYTLQHAEVTIELSNVYMGADDYFEAEKLLRDAEEELDQIRILILVEALCRLSPALR